MKKLFAVAVAVLAGTAMLAFAGCGSQNGPLAEGGLGGGAGTQAEAVRAVPEEEAAPVADQFPAAEEAECRHILRMDPTISPNR